MTVAPAAKPVARKTLASVVGSTVAALALFTLIPREESGRTVEATIAPDQSVQVRHISGRQYLRAYLDIVGVPTACDGITKGVKLGQTFSEAQCAVMLERDIIAHAEPVIACMPGLYGRPYQVVGAVSLAFNIGTAGVCKSSIPTYFNAGRWREGCDRLPLFNKAGGKVLPGLVARRAREREYCLTGLDPARTPDNLAKRLKEPRP